MTTYLAAEATTVTTRRLFDPSPATAFMVRTYEGEIARPASGQLWPRFAAALWPPQTPALAGFGVASPALPRNPVTPGGS